MVDGNWMPGLQLSGTNTTSSVRAIVIDHLIDRIDVVVGMLVINRLLGVQCRWRIGFFWWCRGVKCREAAT